MVLPRPDRPTCFVRIQVFRRVDRTAGFHWPAVAASVPVRTRQTRCLAELWNPPARQIYLRIQKCFARLRHCLRSSEVCATAAPKSKVSIKIRAAIRLIR